MHMAPQLKGPNAKHYIVTALSATLAVAAVITIIFVVLSPARVVFSVTDAGVSHQYEGGGVELALTLAANNTSRRAAVEYRSMFVDVMNHTMPKFVYYVRASLAPGMPPLVQHHRSVENITATVSLLGAAGWSEYYTSNMTNNDFTVIVTAVVRFKVASARTRLYDIKVSCKPVKFFNAGAKKHSGAAASIQQPVECF